ncbi:hypothetical protein [Streptosporangium roseum]|uniref:Uncharacterized protein n=1 Tax=Streptosporangium roseum (strain ATCC 12428 / DSM 43021 / JCM 3005 / KCTC 9067 / NCIMB 10171 / NRRL 2505 / NI 9100) TaxID=479432 RepID=D2AUI1_STRRD|nr:hypothetical protein [Streptosporangium roseum]ACZ84843.1 hypothetical protein Sros_1855 [Streptosporangium roseum DSM 43021]
MSLDMDAHIKALVAQAPPFTPTQVARLQVILWGPQVTPLPVEAATPDVRADVAA